MAAPGRRPAVVTGDPNRVFSTTTSSKRPPVVAATSASTCGIGVVTGRAMGPLMPQVLADVAATTGGRFELVVVENTLFGPSVTTAGLLPGAAIERALTNRQDLDFVLLPAEAVNDDLVFVDDVSAGELAERLPCPVHLSYDFADVLSELGSRNAEVGTDQHGSAFRVPRSAFGAGQG